MTFTFGVYTYCLSRLSMPYPSWFLFITEDGESVGFCDEKGPCKYTRSDFKTSGIVMRKPDAYEKCRKCYEFTYKHWAEIESKVKEELLKESL